MANEKGIVCPHCAAVNRTAGRSAQQARCGACKQALFEGRAADADGRMFDRQMGRSDIPVLVDVWAPWCGPCRIMAPAFEEAAAKLEPLVRLIRLNSDGEPQISARLGIRSIPTMLLFRGGREVARTSGAMNTRQILDWTRERLDAG